MNFKSKIDIKLHCGGFSVHTISTSEEWREVLDLRRRCFPALTSIQSEYDLLADHLVVRDLVSGRLCGAYRVLSTENSLSFESARDFDLGPILAKPGAKLELAWACIDPAYRDGRVVGLLWQGISACIRETQAKVLFGVTSVFERDHGILPEIQKYLADPPSGEIRSSLRGSLRRRVLPALLRAYLMAGAIIWAQPAFDEENNCYDFMTVLEIESAAPAVLQHFHL